MAAGAFPRSTSHSFYDESRRCVWAPPHFAANTWDESTAMLDAIPPERRHLRIHAGHNCWVVPEEERFVTPEVIRHTCIVGTADEVVERLNALGEAGLTQLAILPPLAVKER